MSKTLLKLILVIFFFSPAYAIDECNFYNNEGVPCIKISKTPNTSSLNKKSINKIIINKNDIRNMNAIDAVDVLKKIPGLDVFQSGQKGQQASLFTRGSESNHTLVLLNGIPINDQSTTDGLHDFGQDFIQTIQQIEIYKGSNGAHFGPSAIGGAINFITATDYSNSVSVSGFDEKNYSSNLNHTKITENNWHLNFKAAYNQSETDSAISGGLEDDGLSNNQYNLNIEKWISNELKFNSVLYGRQTKSDYDGSSSDERGYTSDNKMYAFQSGVNHKTRDAESYLTFHYHNYDRDYENSGYLDEYYSESIVLKGEQSNYLNENISYGYGSEYKYDWGNFENRGSYSASTKGHMKNFSAFGNFGIKNENNLLLSFYGRIDDHNTTGGNYTYKLNFVQSFNNFSLGLTNTTGLRNPSLYELYGSDNFGIVGNTNLNAEKSETNEVNFNYEMSNNINFKTSLYRTKIFDRIESNGSYTTFENFGSAINQEGIETTFLINLDRSSISAYLNSSKSRKSGDAHQSRRPDLSYGINLIRKFNFLKINDLVSNLNYKYTGKYLDWNGSSNSFQKSTDIVDLAIKKDLENYTLSFHLSNLLNERYEKPATYSQDGRQFRFLLTKFY